MIYGTGLITSTHRELLQFQTRRQAHLPLADVEEVVAGRLAGPIRRGEGRRAIIMKHAPERRRPAPFTKPALDFLGTPGVRVLEDDEVLAGRALQRGARRSER